MMNHNETHKSLNNLVDPTIAPVAALARRMNTTPETMFQLLSTAYDAALAEGCLHSDNSGDSFETEFSHITLVPNTNFESRYDCYLRFEMKENAVPFSTLVEVEQEAPETQSALPVNLDDNVILVRDNLIRLNYFMTGIEDEPSDETIEMLKLGYLVDKGAGLLKPYGEAFKFQTGLQTIEGYPILASIKPIPSEANPNAWMLNYVGYEKSATTAYFTDAIENFADFGNGTYLQELAELARPEKWYFGEDEDHYEILRNYVAYTFGRLKLEDKICISEDETFAAFNTGLATAHYEDIYMCFKHRIGDVTPAWKYAGVTTAARGYLGKQLVRKFTTLPEPAEYIQCKEDAWYDRTKKLFIDGEHIVLERLHRIPVEFLQTHLAVDPQAADLLDFLEIAGDDRAYVYEELRDMLQYDGKLYEKLRDGVQRVVDKTVQMIRWNYRLPIPSYYPKGNATSLLLPMDFTDCGRPQAALVVQRTESGNYIGHTLLNMPQAYLNARLISSQESSWLTA